MTSAGNINLGVEIDASDIRSELTEAVREAMAPVLLELQKDLRGVQDEYGDTSKAARRSATEQRSAAKTVEGGIHGITNEQRKLAAQASSTGMISTRALNSQTRAINEQARAWDRVAAAKARAAAIPDPDPPRGPPRTPRGGGGGGRGNGGGGAFGDLFTGQGGGGRFITSPIGLNAIALGARGIPAATTAVVNLTGAVQNLLQAGAAAPGIFASMGASAATAAIGFTGMSDAIKKVWEATASGDPKDLKKAAEALEALSPAAAKVVTTIGRDLYPQLKELRTLVQENMFSGVAEDLTSLADKQLPSVRRNLDLTSRAWNETIREILRVGSSDKVSGIMDRIFGNTAEGQKRANAAIEPLVNSFGKLSEVGSSFVPRLADGLTDLANRFDRFISKAASTGDLAKWIDEGFRATANLGESLLNVLKIVTDLTRAAGGDGGFLKWLRDATGELHRFLSSTEGQAKLTAFFDEGRATLREWLPVLRDLGKLAIQVGQGFGQWGALMLPVLSKVLGILTSMPNVVAAVVTAFLAWRSIRGIADLSSAIGGLGGKLDSLPGKASRASQGLNAITGKLGTLRAQGGLALLGAGLSAQGDAESGLGQGLGALGTIGGATIAGSAFGPGGALVGAGIGVAAAGVAWAIRDVSRANAEAAASWDAYNTRMSRAAEATLNMRDAQKTLTDSLLESKGSVDSTAVGAVQDQISNIPDLLGGKVSPEAVEATRKAMADLNLTQQQLATTVTGSQPVFDALVTNLKNLGPGGFMAADALSRVRDTVLQAQQAGQTAGPALSALAQTMNTDIPQAAANLRTVFQSLPPQIPINVTTTGGEAVLKMLQDMNLAVRTDNDKNIVVDAPAAATVLDTLKAIGVEARIEENKLVVVNVDDTAAKSTMEQFQQQYAQLSVNLVVGGPNQNTNTNAPRAGGTFLPGWAVGGRAGGGVLPGWSPGVDNMLVPMSGGEGVLIPEAVRGIGGAAAVYAINSRFRKGLSRQGYADGGVVGGVPGMDDNTELGVLRQIRDLLAGKGNGPLSDTARDVGEIAKAGSGVAGGGQAGGAKLGPFGTPLKPRNGAYDAAAAAIRALGGDPEVFLGMDPAKLPTSQGGMLPSAGGARGGGANMAQFAAALAAFARSGNISDLGGTGLGAGDSVVKAIASARNKKTGGLSDDAIAALVNQVIGGGGFTGTLDPTNTSLVGSLESYRKKLGKTAGGGGLVAGVPMVAGGSTGSNAGLKPGAVNLKAVIEQMFPEVKNIGGYRANDPFPDHPSGNALDIMTGGDAALGARINQFLQDNAEQLGLKYSLWQQQEWNPSKGGPIPMENRGSATANHMDHVHAMLAEQGGVGGPLAAPGVGGGLLATTGAGGTPVFVTNWPGQGGGLGIGGNILGAGLTAGGQAGAGVAGDVLSGIAGGIGPNVGNAPSADLLKLVKERNPMALLAAMGFDIKDFSSAGGGGDDFARIDKPFDASGRMFSDTASLSDRTTASLWGQLDAMRKQLADAIDQVADKLTEDALKPIVESAIQSGLEGLKDSVMSGIGTSLGQAAGPPIADAVKSAIPSDAGNAGGGVVESVAGAAFADGGGVGGTFIGRDSVPALLMPGEHVFTRGDVAAMGGQSNVYAFRRALRNGGVRGFATGGGVNVNDTVGAEFFGVSEVPIISTIVNLLVQVLLKVLGVEIEARDTLNEMTDNFRQFRGEFKAFDASGRLFNDTSGLVDRSSTSEATAAAERIRILKIVIEALIKYIIEKVIVPIGKAVANAAFSAAGSAAGAAVNTQAPGAGGIVSSLITSAGSAATDIVAEIGTDLALAITSVAVEAIGEAIMSYFPDLANMLFGGGALESFLIGPLTRFITDPILGLLGGFMGAISGLFGGLFGGASTLIPGLPFDEGGLATGMGMMPKATIKPERVLSPAQTEMWDRMIAALERGGSVASQRTIEVHAPITVLGGTDAGQSVQQSILDMVNG